MLQNDAKAILTLMETKDNESLISYKNCDFFSSDIIIDKLTHFLTSGGKVSFFDMAECLNKETVFDLSNRKYLGSKSNLLTFIGPAILEAVGRRIETFFDPFAGTGIVSQWMRSYADKVIVNDILFSNFLGLQTFFSSQRNDLNVGNLQTLIAHCNELKPEQGYVFSHFGGSYFTGHNAAKIDAIREEIEHLYKEKKCTLREKQALLVSLLYAIDKCANTVGQYDAFLKHIGSQVMVKGKHKVDSNVYKPVFLRRPFIFFNNNNEVHKCNANKLSSTIKADVVYLDPPYNHRQYIDCYHVLENIMLWEKPETFGKTRKFKRDHLKSDYSRKVHVSGAFIELIGSLQCRHLFLSYNSEGIISDEELCTLLRTRGKLEIFEKEYTIFGHGAGVSKKRPIKERLFYVRVL